MKFEWLKKLFKKNNESQLNTSGLATLDTSLLNVPKFSELNEEAKEKVLNLLKGLNYENYESLLKYSDDILTKSDHEREVLISTMDRYEKEFTSINNLENYNRKLERIIINVMISGLEYRMILQDILETRKELELRLIALDMFIKRESKRKIDFLGVFGKADRMKYLNNQMRLHSELDRLRTMIKTNDNILDAVSREIYAARNIRKEYEIQGRDSRLEKDIRNELSNYLYSYPHNLPTYKTIWGYWNSMIEVVKRMEGYKDVNGNIIDANRIKEYIDEATKWGEDNNWDNVTKEMPREFIDVMYYESAKYYHNLELYAYEHKDDYKRYLEEMNKIIKELESTPTREWNKNELDSIVDKYCNEVAEYCAICKRYVSKDVEKMLFYSVVNIMNYRNYLEKSNREWYRKDSERDFWRYFESRYDRNDAQKYSLAKTWDILRKVEEKYGVEAIEMRKKLSEAGYKAIKDLDTTYDDEIVYRELRNTPLLYLDFETLLFGFASVLHDLDIGRKDSLNLIYRNSSYDFYNDIHRPDKFYRIYVDRGDDQTLEEVLYTLRFLGNNDSFLNINTLSIGVDTVPEHYGTDEEPMLNFVRRIYQNDIEDKYDDRIKVLTRAVRLYDSPLENHSSIVINDDHYIRNINEIRKSARTEAIYVSTPEQFVEMIKRSDDISSNFKYIMADEDTINNGVEKYLERRVGKEELGKIRNNEIVKGEANVTYRKSLKIVNDFLEGNRRIKLATVPKINHYSELTEYLNELQLPLMHPKKKVKVKKLIER